MELPPELVSIIREYSKPMFRYFREVNAYKRIHLKADRLTAKLKGKDADRVYQYLCAYLDSTDDLRSIEYKNHMDKPRDLTVELYRVHEEVMYREWLSGWHHHELQSEILGRDVVWWEFAPYKNGV